MRGFRVWVGLAGLQRAVVEGVEIGEGGEVVVLARPGYRERGRCPFCRRRCARYDQGTGRRRWRCLDLGSGLCFVEADAPRVSCGVHGVVVASVPWARHGSRFTRSFEDQVCWLATRCSRTAVRELMRIAWRSVGSIIARVWAEVRAAVGDRLDGLRRIGIDEISYKRGYRYLTVIVDHDSGRLVWAAEGRDRATVRAFFDQLGARRCALLSHITSDQADWIAQVVCERCPDAVRCADPFHVVRWATEALDEVRRQSWRDARARGRTVTYGRRKLSTGDALKLKHARYALWKNPDDLTDHQAQRLQWIAITDPRLYRAYLLKEGLRYVFAVKGQAGKEALARWLSWARRCQIPAFTALARQITRARQQIHATLEHRLTNALIESVNTRIRLLTRIAFGFHSAQALIALAMLSLGGHQPSLPGRDPLKRH